jgi:hypothetical protein
MSARRFRLGLSSNNLRASQPIVLYAPSDAVTARAGAREKHRAAVFACSHLQLLEKLERNIAKRFEIGD